MSKKIEKITSLMFFILMFVFLNQLEANTLPFLIAISGMVSCGGLAVIFLMHGADLSFKLNLDAPEPSEPITESYYPSVACPSTRPEIVNWYNKTNAA